MKNFQNSAGLQVIRNWMAGKGLAPFDFQQETWRKYGAGYSGMVIAPTGFGKTYSVFLAVITDFMNFPEKYGKGLKLLWITPLRALAKDLAKELHYVFIDSGAMYRAITLYFLNNQIDIFDN